MTDAAYEKRRARREVEREVRLLGESLAAYHARETAKPPTLAEIFAKNRARQGGVSADAEPVGVEATEAEGEAMSVAEVVQGDSREVLKPLFAKAANATDTPLGAGEG